MESIIYRGSEVASAVDVRLVGVGFDVRLGGVGFEVAGVAGVAAAGGAGAGAGAAGGGGDGGGGGGGAGRRHGVVDVHRQLAQQVRHDVAHRRRRRVRHGAGLGRQRRQTACPVRFRSIDDIDYISEYHSL